MAATVSTWDELEGEFWGTDDHSSGALLLGNGFSINIWTAFNYASLLNEAGLDEQALKFFGDRTDFEGVLAELAISSAVVATLSDYSELVKYLEQIRVQIRDGLLAAVGSVHPEAADLRRNPSRTGTFGVKAELDRDRLQHLGPLLKRYARIFTTNYDLLTYWPSVEAGIVDLFPSDAPFDVTQAEDWLGNEYWSSKLLFLHGALHLVRDRRTGAEFKVLRDTSSLLESIRSSLQDPMRSPLFISEGSSIDKVASIRASEYLSFTLRALKSSNSPLTVLGHSLSQQDAHICRALEAHPDRPVAIGVHLSADSSHDELAEKGRELNGRIPACKNVTVFDSHEHPLTA